MAVVVLVAVVGQCLHVVVVVVPVVHLLVGFLAGQCLLLRDPWLSTKYRRADPGRAEPGRSGPGRAEVV